MTDKLIQYDHEKCFERITEKQNFSDINGLMQDCSNYSAFAMELLQTCTKPSMWLPQYYCNYPEVKMSFIK